MRRVTVQSCILEPYEEMWTKGLSTVVDEQLLSAMGPLTDRSLITGSPPRSTAARDKTQVVSF